MNKYYNFTKTADGLNLTYKHNNELMAFWSYEDKQGFILKNYVDSVEYKTITRWLKGLKIHRDVIAEEINFN